MKKLLLFPLLFLTIFTLSLFGGKKCECGTHATGIYAYTVGQNGSCCGSTPGATGMYHEYELEDGDVWVLVSSTAMSGFVVQNICCHAS